MLVLFYGDEDQFEVITVSSKATAEEIISKKDVKVALDLAGINNRFIHVPVGLYVACTDP